MTTNHYGHKIKKLRELRNLTQDYMAEQLGIKQPAYSKIETDTGKIDVEKLEIIAQALQMTLPDLLAFDEKNVFNNNGGSYNNINSGTNNFTNEKERELYERVIASKDAELKAKTDLIEHLKKS